MPPQRVFSIHRSRSSPFTTVVVGNLPGFVVLSFGVVPCGGMEIYSSGFLSVTHQATLFAAEGTPIDNITPGDGNSRIQQLKLSLLKDRDAAFAARSKAVWSTEQPTS